MILDIEGLSVDYALPGKPAQRAVKHLSLKLEQGQVYGFLGPNGAGKTTTIKALLGFLRPTEGTVRVLGKDPYDKQVRFLLGYVPENAYYYPFLKPKEILHFYGKIFKLPSKLRKQRIERLLNLVGLEDHLDKPLHKLSKGLRQRLGLAQALINDPKLVILDEPASGLDPLGRAEVRSIIEDLKAEGKTIFFSSHELSEVELVADHIGIMSEGQLLVSGNREQLLEGQGKNLERYFIELISKRDRDALYD